MSPSATIKTAAAAIIFGKPAALSPETSTIVERRCCTVPGLARFRLPWLAGDGVGLFRFVAEARVMYRAPGFFGEPVVTDCRVSWIGRSSFGIEYRVEALGSAIAPARLLADGDTAQVMYDVSRGRVTRVPPDLAERMEAFEGRALPRRYDVSKDRPTD